MLTIVTICSKIHEIVEGKQETCSQKRDQDMIFHS